jgi:hypothetical protein
MAGSQCVVGSASARGGCLAVPGCAVAQGRAAVCTARVQAGADHS